VSFLSAASAAGCSSPHGLAHARKLGDTSRQGRYHNRRYATLARELGLDVTHLQPIGWSTTSVPEPTAARYTEVLAELGAALVTLCGACAQPFEPEDDGAG
jgi:hypothetical protein